MIKGIKFVSIPVSDQDRALAFYTDKPFDVLFTADAHKDRIGTFSGISFHGQDLQKTYDELVAQGVEFAGPPKKEPWGSFVIVSDSDGNQFVLSAR